MSSHEEKMRALRAKTSEATVDLATLGFQLNDRYSAACAATAKAEANAAREKRRRKAADDEAARARQETGFFKGAYKDNREELDTAVRQLSKGQSGGDSSQSPALQGFGKTKIG